MNASDQRFDPTIGSQRVFRCLLAATSRPGTLSKLPDGGTSPDITILCAVLDNETSFGTIGVEPETANRLHRNTGARLVSPEKAHFVLVRRGESASMLTRMRRGTLDDPHLGATAVFAVKRLSSDGPLRLILSGPGVDGESVLGVEGLAVPTVEAVKESRAEYPRGVDVYIVDEAGRVAGLPRSTTIEVEKAT